MIVYLDSNYICHLNYDESYIEVETDFFNDKCEILIENYRYIPPNHQWVRSDGVVFYGEMISPAINYDNIKNAQLQYEIDNNKMQDMKNALDILGVNP